MKTIIAKLTAMAPISHGAFDDGGDVGNAMLFRREPIVSLDGFPRVPVVSGNSLRGILRRGLMREVLLNAEITIETFEEVFSNELQAKRAWDRMYAVLACGGTLEGALDDTVRPEETRTLRREFPALSLLGSAMYTKMIGGMAQIGFVWPVCSETIAGGLVQFSECKYSAEEIITEVGQVRHIDRENADPELTGVKPMPITIEALATGTTLESRIKLLPHSTSIERACLVHGLRSLSTIGGKSGSGFGVIDVSLSDDDDVEYTEWLNARKPGGPKHEEFKKFITEFARKLG